MKNDITKKLNIYGWDHLDPIILASLASEYPMLLIGKHGSAKSYVLERLAKVLNYSYRFYNASLINYDDLVGIPVPDETKSTLNYISSPNSIWNAEVVFIDEINRTRPELQNKLFPIIYDKRVQGIDLKSLKYRWAAMNPSFISEDEEDINYLGAMPLDPALADRFAFIVNVPTWEELTDSDKALVLKDSLTNEFNPSLDLISLINETKEEYKKVVEIYKDSATKYIISLVSLLNGAIGYISARRVNILLNTLLYTYAAQIVINREEKKRPTFKDAAYIHIQNTLSIYAEKEVDRSMILNICDKALKLADLDKDYNAMASQIKDPVKRLKFVLENQNNLSAQLMNDVVVDSIAEMKPELRRGASYISYLKLRSNEFSHASMIETLCEEVRKVIAFGHRDESTHYSSNSLINKIYELVDSIPNDKPYKKPLNNILYSYFRDGLEDSKSYDKIYRNFIDLWEDLLC